VFATQGERRATGWAEGTVEGGCLFAVRGAALECQILQHARAQAVEMLVKRSFNLAQRGFGMVYAPVTHATQDLGAQGFSDSIVQLAIRNHAVPP
jgi:hypothetical protein